MNKTKYLIRGKEYEVCHQLANYYIVQNINKYNSGDFVLGHGVIHDGYILNDNHKEYYLISKKSKQVFASFKGFHIHKKGYTGNLKYGKANWVIAKTI
jgi:hypothetical protein